MPYIFTIFYQLLIIIIFYFSNIILYQCQYLITCLSVTNTFSSLWESVLRLKNHFEMMHRNKYKGELASDRSMSINSRMLSTGSWTPGWWVFREYSNFYGLFIFQMYPYVNFFLIVFGLWVLICEMAPTPKSVKFLFVLSKKKIVL